MIAAARSVGASSAFTGSGGAIAGVLTGDDMYRRLETALAPLKVVLFRPQIVV